jgi:hypothetical protein
LAVSAKFSGPVTLLLIGLGVGAWFAFRPPATPRQDAVPNERDEAVSLALRTNNRDAGASITDLGIEGVYAVSIASTRRHHDPTRCFVWGKDEIACGIDSVTRMIKALGLLSRKEMTNEHWQRLVFFFANVHTYYPKDALESPDCKTKRFEPRVTRLAAGGVEVDVIAGRPDIGHEIVPYQVRVSIAPDAKLSIAEEAWCPETAP